MNILATAIMIAAEGFVDKVDKAGEPYIMHCLRVMNGLHTRDEELQAIAVLHDVVEDGITTFKQLRDVGFSDRVINGIMYLTHLPEESYDTYIKRVAMSEDAKLVKREDLKDNSNITRLKGLRKKDFDRIEKYHKAFTYLSN